MINLMNLFTDHSNLPQQDIFLPTRLWPSALINNHTNIIFIHMKMVSIEQYEAKFMLALLLVLKFYIEFRVEARLQIYIVIFLYKNKSCHFSQISIQRTSHACIFGNQPLDFIAVL